VIPGWDDIKDTEARKGKKWSEVGSYTDHAE